ncbi:MAG: hypothetical protein IJN21_04425 [Clostridia bacterium]|nr:hypothetical protein [Clostridiales bacterium]MBQ6715752.1 hypothetical protein [Clostridia bacterium]
MTQFYTEKKLLFLKKRAGILRAFLIVLMTIALFAAIVMCFFVSSKTAGKLLLAIIIEFTLSGWISILVLNLAYLPAVREYRHMEHIIKEEKHSSEGYISLSPMEFQIPKSISIRKLTLTDGENIETLSVNSRFAGALAKSGYVRVQHAKGYVTGIEVIG